MGHYSQQLWQFCKDSIYNRDTVNFWLQKIHPLWSGDTALGRIVKKTAVTEQMTALVVQCNRHFQFGLAGQHHPVFVWVDGVRYERTYSLTQIDEHHLQINVKKVPQGKVSTWLCDQAAVGDILEFGLPYGEVPALQSGQPLLLLCAGSGITPMISILSDLIQQKRMTNQSVELFYWVKNQQDCAFYAQLQQWQQNYPTLKIHYFYTQQEPKDQRICADHLMVLTTDLSDYQVMICGPSGFVKTAQQLTVSAPAVYAHAFSLTDIVVNPQAETLTVQLQKSQKTVLIRKGQPILQGLEQANIYPQHGCRMGICNKCTCRKIQGQTQNLNDGLHNSEPQQDIRICVNTAQSDLILDL